jgi:hypothetical protein
MLFMWLARLAGQKEVSLKSTLIVLGLWGIVSLAPGAMWHLIVVSQGSRTPFWASIGMGMMTTVFIGVVVTIIGSKN